MNWHTALERFLIDYFGGTPLVKYGYDGVIFDNRPVEVRVCRKDTRYRIQKDVHRDLIQKGGYYIFHTPGVAPLLFTAKQVNDMLKPGPWFKDRGYSHKFLKVRDVFQ